MQRPTPTQNEITFGLDEMFFSTTNNKGVILDGNDVFVRISQYSREELIGAPHNIIRHPDMPKIVFKALWDTIQTGKPICAYVKNLAKDGSYYWVFATVLPYENGYISIRMKPTANLLGAVEGLYKELLHIEQESGMEASLKLLLNTLNSLGFPNYEAFVLAAINAELTSRHELQNQSPPPNSITIYGMNTRDFISISQSLYKIFFSINKVSSFAEVFKEKTRLIEEITEQVEFSALNTIIEADKLGNKGLALGVVAKHISSNSKASKEMNTTLSHLSNKMLGDIGSFKNSQLSIALSTLQSEMLSSFAQQVIHNPSSTTEKSFKSNCLMLLSLVSQSLNHVKPIVINLEKEAERISDELSMMSKILMRMDFIQTTGSIESARLIDNEDFSALFQTIFQQVEQSKTLFAEYGDKIGSLVKEIEGIIQESTHATRTVSTVNRRMSMKDHNP